MPSVNKTEESQDPEAAGPAPMLANMSPNARASMSKSASNFLSLRSTTKAVEDMQSSITDEELIERLRDETRESVPARFHDKLNTGLTLEPESHFLSWDYMLEYVAANRPTWFDENGEKLNVSSYNMHVGMHLPSACCDGKPGCHANSMFAKFGVGTSLYFKYLKFMCIMFLVMSLLSVPSMIFWYNGTNYDYDAKDTLLSLSEINFFYFLSMGSWGGSAYMCETLTEGQRFNLECSKGTIQKIKLHYGEPGGYCSCPTTQQPLSSGDCPSDYQYGPNEMSGGDLCCSADSTQQGLADLELVEPYSVDECTSNSAKYIAHGVCLGKASCTINATADLKYSWYSGDSICSPYDTEDDPNALCGVSFLDLGNFSGCTDQCDFVSWDQPWNCNSTANMELTIEAWCQSDTVMDVDKGVVGLYIAFMDSVCILLFWAMCVWLGKKQREEAALVNGNVCSASDYTVQLDGLPHTADHDKLKDDLREHFKRVLNDPALCPRVKNDLECSVVDINFAIAAESRAINLRTKLGALAIEIERLMTKIMLTTQFMHKKGKSAGHVLEFMHRKQAFLMTRFQKLDEDLQQATARVASDKRVSAAFVTFNTEEAYVRCRRAYPSLGRAFTHFTQARALRLQGYQDVYARLFCQQEANWHGFRLNVSEAPEPTDILWENFGMDTLEVVARRGFTAGLTFVLLLVSFAVIYLVETYKTSIQSKYNTASECNYDYYYNVHENTTYLPGSEATDVTAYDVVLDYKWELYNQTTGNTGLLGCMCDELVATEGLTYMLNYEFFLVNVNGGGVQNDAEPLKWCDTYYTNQLKLYSVLALSVIVVEAVNISLAMLAEWCGSFNRYISLSMRSASVTWRLFMATFFNTSLLILAINGNLYYFNSVDTDSIISFNSNLELLGGDYSDFTPNWYLYVGVPLFTQILVKVLSGPLGQLAAWGSASFKRYKDRKFLKFAGDVHISKQATQEDLNMLYVGGEFKVKNRYAVQLCLIFSILLYSAALPMLWVLAAIAFAFWLLVDKFLFVNYYARPPQFDESLANTAAGLLPYAVLIHVMFSMWMFSEEEIFTLPTDDDLPSGAVSNSTATDDDALLDSAASSYLSELGAFSRLWSTTRNGFALIVFLIVFLHLFCRDFLLPLLKQSTWIFTLFPCLRCCINIDEDWEDNKPYFDAIHHKRLIYGIEHPETLSPEVCQQYAEALETRKKSGRMSAVEAEQGTMDQTDLESYNFTANKAYAGKFHITEVNLIGHVIKDSIRRAQEAGEDHHAGHVMESFHAFSKSTKRGFPAEEGTLPSPVGEGKEDEAPEPPTEPAPATAPAPEPEPEPEPAPTPAPAPAAEEPAPAQGSQKLVPLPDIAPEPTPAPAPAAPASDGAVSAIDEESHV